MAAFRSGRITEVIAQRPGLQKVAVRLDGDADSSLALNYSDLIGTVVIDDDVICNTTAVELGLGTGGWHLVHWNLSRREFRRPSGGHIMKLRYTPMQTDVLAAEEDSSPLHEAIAGNAGLDGMPVVVAGLHSLVAAVVAGAHSVNPGLNVTYIMTDAAALPLAFSDLVADLRRVGLLFGTVTVGQAFGGELEAVTVASGLVAAHAAGAAIAVVAPGPGIVGTDTALGTTGREVAWILQDVAALGGCPVACIRASYADRRNRHRGVSHHTLNALSLATSTTPPIDVVVPALGGGIEADLRTQLDSAGISSRHRIVHVDPGLALDVLGEHGLTVQSMGRSMDADQAFWQAGAAAGVHAALNKC